MYTVRTGSSPSLDFSDPTVIPVIRDGELAVQIIVASPSGLYLIR
ncbi:hypothetical protein [Candidatus Ichthyocystis sparus]|nr:hypothetical protein [Candidatus Ichthyocystis sparus]